MSSLRRRADLRAAIESERNAPPPIVRPTTATPAVGTSGAGVRSRIERTPDETPIPSRQSRAGSVPEARHTGDARTRLARKESGIVPDPPAQQVYYLPENPNLVLSKEEYDRVMAKRAERAEQERQANLRKQEKERLKRAGEDFEYQTNRILIDELIGNLTLQTAEQVKHIVATQYNNSTEPEIWALAIRTLQTSHEEEQSVRKRFMKLPMSIIEQKDDEEIAEFLGASSELISKLRAEL